MINLSAIIQLTTSAFVIGSLYGLLGVGLNVSYGTVRLLNVAYGDLLMIGAYVGFLSFTLFAISPIVSLLTAGAIDAALGYAIYWLAARRVIKRSATTDDVESQSLLVFFGLLIIMESLVALIYTPNPREYPFFQSDVTLGPISILGNRLVASIIAVTAIVIVYLIIGKTWFGRTIKYVMEDRLAAALIGVNIDRVYLTTTMFGFALAGLAGVLVSVQYVITPNIGLQYTVAALVVVIIAGLGSIRGSIAAGFILSFLETYGTFLTSPVLRIVITYGVFIVLVIIRPRGLFGRK